MRNHQFVRVSPIQADTLQINGRKTPKLLREVSMRELHNDMVESVEDGGLECALDSDGKSRIGDSSLRKILKKEIPELRKANERHKQMCGCENCIGIRYLQVALNLFRTNFIVTGENHISILQNIGSRENQTRSRRGNLENLRQEENELKEYQDLVMPDRNHLHAKPKDALEAVMCPSLL